MNQHMSHRGSSAALLPSAMEQKLAQISRRQATICVLRSIAIGASVLIAAMVVAMLIDWQWTLFDTGIRAALTITAVLLAAAALLATGVPPLRSVLKRLHAATDADAEIPQLEERWQTVVTMSASNRRQTSPMATAMLRQVTSEAVAIGRIVQPGQVAHPACTASFNQVSGRLLGCYWRVSWLWIGNLLPFCCAGSGLLSPISLPRGCTARPATSSFRAASRLTWSQNCRDCRVLRQLCRSSGRTPFVKI